MNPQLESVIVEMEKAVRGKRAVIEHMLCALLAGGHILLDDMPGVGKTTLAVALCRAVDLTCRRVQFTPDVLPSDIVGFSMYDASSGQFLYRPGAATHANLLLADEINRTSSKTQSALLEAMEERQITVDGETHPLEKPFVVVATQNNVGTAGTQLLPYAQMDRFMARLSVGYPGSRRADGAAQRPPFGESAGCGFAGAHARGTAGHAGRGARRSDQRRAAGLHHPADDGFPRSRGDRSRRQPRAARCFFAKWRKRARICSAAILPSAKTCRRCLNPSARTG